MSFKYDFLVFAICLFLPYVSSVQLRLVNSNQDNSYASRNNYEPDVYNYNYGISNQATRDHKTAWENKENGVVRGAYSVVDPDGSTKLVEYIADVNGFHPVVTRLNTLPKLPAYSQLDYNANVQSTLDAYNPAGVTYRDQYNNLRSVNSNYDNIYNDKRYPFQSDIQYRTSILNNGYNNGHFSRTQYSGYDASYKGYDDSTSGAPQHLPLRQERQPVPLLHSTYHGYDNLYH